MGVELRRRVILPRRPEEKGGCLSRKGRVDGLIEFELSGFLF